MVCQTTERYFGYKQKLRHAVNDHVGIELDAAGVNSRLVGKGGHVRTVPMPAWVKDATDAWTAAAGITEGTVFRAHQQGRPCLGQRDDGQGALGRRSARGRRGGHRQAGATRSAPDMRTPVSPGGRRTRPDQFLLGHVSIQTTERYLGCKQKLRHAVNDRLGSEPNAV
jgi:integrase